MNFSRFSHVHFKSKFNLVLCDLLSLMRDGHCVCVLCLVFVLSVLGYVEPGSLVSESLKIFPQVHFKSKAYLRLKWYRVT